MLLGNGFKSFISRFSHNISISRDWSLKWDGSWKQEKHRTTWALAGALVCGTPRRCGRGWGWGRCHGSPEPRHESVGATGLSSARASSPTPSSCGCWEPGLAIREVAPAPQWFAQSGFFVWGMKRWSHGSPLHSGWDIHFVLSLVYWLSFTQIFLPGGFIYFVDKFEFDTTKFEPEIISYTTIYGSNQISTTLYNGLEICQSWSSIPNQALIMWVWPNWLFLSVEHAIVTYYWVACL